jgi:hypothetical protein
MPRKTAGSCAGCYQFENNYAIKNKKRFKLIRLLQAMNVERECIWDIVVLYARRSE